MSAYTAEWDGLLDDLDVAIYEIRKFVDKLDRTDGPFGEADYALLEKTVKTLAGLEAVSELSRP